MSGSDDDDNGTSVQKKDWFGDDYTEHQDGGGNVTGRSEEKTDWFGDDYIEHQDGDGNVTGRSEEKTDWFGDDYTEHQDGDGNETGRSEEKTDWFGDDYTEHQDGDGNVTGRSEEKTDWFGDDYTEHRASGPKEISSGGSSRLTSGGGGAGINLRRTLGNVTGIGSFAGGTFGVIAIFILVLGGYIAFCWHIIQQGGKIENFGDFILTLIAVPGIIVLCIILFIIVAIMFVLSLFFPGI